MFVEIHDPIYPARPEQPSATISNSSDTIGHSRAAPRSSLVAIQITRTTLGNDLSPRKLARTSLVATNFLGSHPTHTTCSTECLLGHSRTSLASDPLSSDTARRFSATSSGSAFDPRSAHFHSHADPATRPDPDKVRVLQ